MSSSAPNPSHVSMDGGLESTSGLQTLPPTNSSDGAGPSVAAPPAVGKKRHGSPLEGPDAWVADIIREATSRPIHEELKAGFLSGNPDMNAATQFFEEVNQKIQEANKNHGVAEDKGVIPVTAYGHWYNNWLTALEVARRDQNSDAAWESFDYAYSQFQKFNQTFSLPRDWNINAASVEQEFGPRVVQSIEEEGHASLFEGSLPDYVMDEVGGSGHSDYDDVTQLDELEAQVKDDLVLSDGEVLFWWKRGTGSQIFVRYGSGSNATYRIRAGAYEFYDPKSVPRVYSTSAWGHQKERFQNSKGEEDERWKYNRDNVEGIIGVGWKIKDDDEDEIEPLELVKPEPYATYPHTRVLIRWKGGQVTLEDRAFVRRITRGSSIQGDRVIYQKALTQEVRYRRSEGLPYQHLLPRHATKPGRAVTQDVLSDVSEEDTADDVEAAEEPSAVRSTVPATRGSPAYSRGRVGTSEVRFVEPPRRPSTRASSKRASQRPTPSRVQSTEGEDPRDAEIHWLREQIMMLNQMVKVNGRKRPTRNTSVGYDSGYDDGRSDVSENVSRMSQRQGRGRAWDNWAGRWVPAGRAH